MPTCAVTNCWKSAVDFNVGDRLRGSYCEDHQDVAKGDNPHEGASNELDRFGDSLSREGIESDLDRGDDEDFVIPKAEKSGDVAESSAAKTPAEDTVSKDLGESVEPLGYQNPDHNK